MVRSEPRLFPVALCCLCLLALGRPASAQPAAQAPPGPSEKDVVYGVAEGQKLLVDTYRCPTPGPHPALMLIHGGGWAGGDKDAYRGEALYWSQQAGVVCFSINYRHAPKFRYPAQVVDCARAVRWVRAHAKEYDVNPDRIGALGHSAGGHLSLMLGVIKPDHYQSPEDPNRGLSGRVQCLMDLAGPADFTAAAHWPEITLGIVNGFIGATRDQAPDKWAEASPITHVTRDAAAMMMVYGTKDPLVPAEQGERMKAALDKVGVENELIVIKNADHGFQGADKADLEKAFVQTRTWMRRHLGVEPAAP
jgi:acetyl esterase/lipase